MYYSRLVVICEPEYAEILMAEIAEVGFDTFMENEKGFEAYAEQNKYDKEKLAAIKDKYAPFTPVVFYQDRIEKKNWNEEWEKNYEPIIVDDTCLIRAAFHIPEKKYPYEIIITPKMSFGTGHHQTTYLMIKSQLAMDHQNKEVMDAGCGTAILSVMASKLGAASVEAFDIDEWSVINGNENAEVNGCKNITIRQGKINKNILLEEMEQYANHLNKNGQLLLSGFYEEDIPDLTQKAALFGLHPVSSNIRENWASLLLQKK
jgi:ribosomal protein L11 methyltransferase